MTNAKRKETDNKVTDALRNNKYKYKQIAKLVQNTNSSWLFVDLGFKDKKQ